MNTRRLNGDHPEQPDSGEPRVVSNTASTATVEPVLYASFAEWLDRDLSRLEDAYKGWATAGYGQWRRSFQTAR